MRPLGLIIFVLLFHLIGSSQPFGNEWINYNQRYLKVPVVKNDLYRINYNELSTAFSNIGINISSVNPRSIQVFGRGIENYIHIEGEADGKFDSTDYLIFYGKRNDGWFDSKLYIKPEYQLNPYYSLITDTAWYYITYSSLPTGKRFKKINNTNFTGKTSAQFVYKESITYRFGIYNEGEKDGAGVSTPLYQEGEGWADYSFYQGQTRIYNSDCRNPSFALGAPAPQVLARTVSKSNAAGSPNHGLLIEYGPTSSKINLIDTSYDGYKMINHQFNIPKSYLNGATTLYFSKKPLTPEPPSDFQTLAFIKIKYAHALQLNIYNSLNYYIPSDIDTTYLSFSGAQSGYFPYAFDLENGVMCKMVQNGVKLETLIPPGTERPIEISRSISSVISIVPSYSRQKGKGWMTDLTQAKTDSAFVIITSKTLWNSASQYRNYKASTGLNSLTFDIEDIYEQFSYGIKKHRLAIQNFIEYQNSKPNNSPQYVFLIGKSIKENLTRQNSTNQKLNMIPTVGVPPADNLFGTPMDNINLVPVAATGRLAANNDQVVLDYLNKVIEFESAVNNNSPLIEDRLWRKKGIHFAGGNDINQQNVFVSFLKSYENSW